MSKFTEKDRKLLLSNRFVKSVSSSQVLFTPEFKLKALKMHAEGLSPSNIFLKLGIDPNLFLIEYPKKCLSRWSKIVEKSGEVAIKEERRGKGGGRPKKSKLVGEKELRAKIAILEAEVDFLKKLRALGDKSESKKGSH
jgi:transposase